MSKEKNYKYSNYFATSYRDEINDLISKEAHNRKTSKQDVVRMAVEQFFANNLNTETPIEKTNNGNEQSKRNDGSREHLYF
jgi:hypothetical protein